MQPLYDWLVHNQPLLQWMVGISMVAAVATIVALPIMVSRIRSDYFLSRKPPPDAWSGRHPVIRLGVKIIKNLVGAVLTISGIWMLVLPGQGLLTLLIGLTMLDFPGKRTLELVVVRRRGVLRALNWIRRRAKRAPLEVAPVEVAPLADGR